MIDFLRWLGLIDDPGTWHLDGTVLARAYPRRRHLRRLAARGVRQLINFAQAPHPQGLLQELGLTELHLPVRDFSAPSLELLQAGVRACQTAGPTSTHPVLIHCGGGFGRTGTLLACLYIEQGLPAQAAIARVRAERPGAIESKAQVAMVHRYAEAKA